jgi:AraC-like DNA-binding protein
MHERWSYDKGLPIRVFRAVDLEFLAHWHTEIELLFVVSGSIAASVNRERRLLRPGSLVACGSRDIHYYERSGSRSETILVIFKPELLGRHPLWPAGGKLGSNFADKAEYPRLTETAERIMETVSREMDERRAAYDVLVRGEIMELCALVERELGVGEGKARESPAGSELATLERMQLAIDFIYERYALPIHLADAAEAAALSPWYFSRLFSATVGTGFRSFLNGVRIEVAEELMADSEEKLVDIALECGFESVRTFNRAYKALRGRPPKATREEAGPHSLTSEGA